MAIKSKNSGAYADITGVSVKTAGTYAAVQGIYAKSGGVYGSVYPAGAAPALSASRTTGVAPFGIVFSAAETTHSSPSISPFHDLLYFYDFGDGSDAEVYTYGQLAGQRSDKYVGGPVVTHTYTKPGVYAPRMWVWDGSTLAGPTNVSTYGPTNVVSTGIVTVQDPDVVYAGAATVVVSTSGTFTGAPAGATQVTSSSYTTVMTAHAASNKRILFRENETFTLSANMTKGSTVNLFVGSFGSLGQKATITPNANGLQFMSGIANGGVPANSPNGWIVTRINLDAGIYPNTQWLSISAMQDVAGDAGAKLYTYGNATMHDVTASDGKVLATMIGYGNVINRSVMQKVAGGAVTSSSIGTYIQGLYSGVSNSKFDAEHGGEHCIRTHCEVTAIQSNYTARPATTKHHITVRGLGVSVQANGVTSRYQNSEYNLIDGSLDTVSIVEPTNCKPTNTGVNEDIRYVRWDNNYYKGMQAQKVMQFIARDASFRGNVVEIAAGSSGVTVVEIADHNVTMTSPNENFYLDSNTARSAGTNGFAFVNLQSAVASAKVRDNIAYAPGAGTNVFIAASSTGISPTFVNNSSNAQITGTDPLFVGAAATFTNAKLQAGSPYVNTAIANYGRRIDAAGFLVGALPQDAGALNNVNKQVDAWTLVP